MSQDNNNRSWSFDINMAGLTPTTGLRMLAEGYYKGKITDMYISPEKPDRVQIKVTVSEGEFQGMVRTTGMNIPKSDEDKVRRAWRALAESCGYSPADLDKGTIKLNPTTFLNRESFFFYSPKAEDGGRDAYETLNFLAPAEWNRQKSVYVPRVAQPAVAKKTEVTTVAAPDAAKAPTVVTAPSLGGSDNTATLGALAALINS